MWASSRALEEGLTRNFLTNAVKDYRVQRRFIRNSALKVNYL